MEIIKVQYYIYSGVTDIETMKGKDMNYLFSFFHSEEEDCLMIYSPTGKILVAQGREISMMEKIVEHGTRSHCWNLLKWEKKYKKHKH